MAYLQVLTHEIIFWSIPIFVKFIQLSLFLTELFPRFASFFFPVELFLFFFPARVLNHPKFTNFIRVPRNQPQTYFCFICSEVSFLTPSFLPVPLGLPTDLGDFVGELPFFRGERPSGNFLFFTCPSLARRRASLRFSFRNFFSRSSGVKSSSAMSRETLFGLGNSGRGPAKYWEKLQLSRSYFAAMLSWN